MIISIIGAISMILKMLKIDDLFVLTFFFLGSIIITSGNYDCFPPAIPGSNGWYLPLFEFWFWLGGVIPLTFFLGFIIIQNTYAEINKERTAVYGILIIGIVLFSIPFENLSIYLYRGFEYFSPSYSCYQTIWLNGIFPIYYLIGIPGIILITYAFIWSVKNREVGEK
jgi:hypothetical protein